MQEKRVLTVTQLNLYVKSLLESSVYLNDIYITGEISNFTDHYKTGHLYLSLKDETGLIKAVMFRHNASKLKFKPQNGMKIICRGKISLYERDGQYQLYITSMQQQGLGDLNLAFEQLKEKLQKEGLFDQSKKRKIPRLPSTVAVITSPTGAAVQDILNILQRRYPICKVVMCPVQVQGDVAAPQMIEAIKKVNELNCADVIIIGRGGGSLEDLWAFNNEDLARAVRASLIPVISAVGHETDFTICDFASDLRAPTPSASAELAVPDKNEINKYITRLKSNFKSIYIRTLQQKILNLKAIMNKQSMKNPLFYINQKSQTVDFLQHRTKIAYKSKLSVFENYFINSAAKLSSLSPLNVLLRGYSMVYKDDTIVTKATQLDSGDKITIRMNDGSKEAVITE